jgi:medium-chain acyl-[acyl-carrier-protein] hydrolase
VNTKPAVRLHAYSDDSAVKFVIYCFPHAGGAAPFYRPWAAVLPPGVGLSAVQLSGRQDMARYPPFPDMESLVSATADAVAEHLRGRRYAFFGHSMGGLTAFETARRLRRAGLPGPELLGISACPAPHLDNARLRLRLHTLSDEHLLARVQALGGLAQEVLDSPELLSMALPVIRADFKILADYKYRAEPPLDCVLTTFGGLADDSVAEESLHAWHEYSSRPMRAERYPGGHFYLADWPSRILDTICNQLPTATARSHGAYETGRTGGRA